MFLLELIDYFKQSPIVPLIFSSLATLIVLMQCLTKRTFYKVRLIISFILTFITVLILVFYGEISKETTKEIYKNTVIITMLAVEVSVCVLLFTTIDFSLSNEKLHKVLTKSLDETKYFVVLDKKDRIKEMSSLLIDDLNVDDIKISHKNFFDVIEHQYRIIGINGEPSLKNDVKKYFADYYKRVSEGQRKTLEINIEDDRARKSALYFNESPIFSHGKYKGRILIGDKKDENSLVGMERDLASKASELDIIKERFIVLLNKTNDGIFFNTVTKQSIWFNDILVKRLNLNGNTMSSSDFYANIHKEDLPIYQERINNLDSNDYSMTYRYNVGAYYVYIKEDGHKVISGDTVEFCGVMNIIDDYRYEKTGTALDSVGSEDEMRARLKALEISDQVFEVLAFRVESIPEINEKFGRNYGNLMLSEYVDFIRKNFVVDNYIYRISGLEFVCFITNYNKMMYLKNQLNNNEKILHVSADISNTKVTIDVCMGIATSNDTPNPKEALDNAKHALKISSNPQYTSNYAYFKDLR